MEPEPAPDSRGRSTATWLLPSFDETTLFLIAVTCVLLMVFNPGFAQGLSLAVFFPLGAWAALGFVLSVFNAFTSHKKTAFEKLSMAVFALVTNAAAGFAVGIERFQGQIAGGRLLAVVNIGTALVLVYQVGWFQEACIPDDDAKPLDLLVGVVALGVVFFLCRLRELPWAITFSICVAYSTLIHGTVVGITRHLGARSRTDSAQRPRPNKRIEQAP